MMRLTAFRRAALTASASIAALALAAPAFAQEPGEEAEEIIVTAQKNNQTEVTPGGSLGILGDKKAEDVPFTIKSYNAALILNQQPQTLGQVLENDPSVRTTYGFGNASEQFVIRGFQLFSDDIGMNGLYGIAPRQLIAPELYESVQVLNGASAFVNGAAPGGSGLGGSVNLILKRAGSKPLNRFTANYTSSSHFGGSFDVSRRFGDVGVRINGVGRSGDVGVDNEFRSTYTLGGAFDFDNGGPLRLSLDLGYQRVKIRGLRPKVTGATSLPVVPASDANYSQPFTYSNLRDVFGVVRAEYDLSDNAMVYAAFGLRDGAEEGIYGGVSLTNTATGAALYTTSITPYEPNSATATAGIRVKLEGGGMSHEVNFGGSMLWQVSRTSYRFYTGAPTNLYNPAPLPFPAIGTVSFANGDLNDPGVNERNYVGSAFASDTIGLWDDRILFTAGVRLQMITKKAYVLPSYYSGSAITPAFGLVVKPVEGVSLYANYMEGFEPGSTAPTTFDDGGVTKRIINPGVVSPVATEQIEFGGKLTLGALTISLGFFQIDRPNYGIRLNPANANEGIYGAFGLQRNRGIEFTVSGDITKGLRVIGGGSVIDAKLRRTVDGTNQGRTAQGVPEYLLNGNVEWDLPFLPGLTVTGRVVHTGKQQADLVNSFALPEWTRVDLGARFVAVVSDKPLTFRFGVDNIVDERYWSSSYDAFNVGLLQGAPRTYKASVSIDL